MTCSLPVDGAGSPDDPDVVVEEALPHGLCGRVEALAAREVLAPFAIVWTAFALLLQRVAEDADGAPHRLTPDADDSFLLAARIENDRLADGAADEGPARARCVPPETGLHAVLRSAHGEDCGTLRLAARATYVSAARLRSLHAAYIVLLNAALTSPAAATHVLPVALSHDRAAELPLDPDRAASALDDDPADLAAAFDSAVRRWPEATAVAWVNGAMTFPQLADAARVFVETLRRVGARSGDVVAFRQMDEVDANGLVLFLVAKIAALKLRCALLPLGLQLQTDQARLQIERARARFLVSTSAEPDCLPHGSAVAGGSKLDAFPSAHLFELHADDPCIRLEPGKTVAILFTSSGTTGAPKTIQVSQEMILDMLRGLTAANVFPDAPFLMGANIGFDVLVVDVWMSWLTGRHVVLVATERRTPDVVAAARDLGAVAISVSPTQASAILDDAPSAFYGYRTLHLMGEVVPPALIERLGRLAPNLRLVNGYGPSETAALATAWVARPMPEARVPIGASLPGVRILIADVHGLPLPAHWPGELLIAPTASAAGYLDPAMTAERFFEVPREALGPFFRSGDHGWVDERGEIGFIGRRDRQVKIAGVRVELNGIEHRIAEVDGVAQVGVVLIEETRSPRIVAVVRPRSGHQSGEHLRATILAHCRTGLLRAAVPSAVVFVTAMPTGASGKKSHAALKTMLANHTLGREADDGPEPDLSPEAEVIATRLVSMWSELLDRDAESPAALRPSQSVAALGASSLDMLRMAERLERAFRITLPDAQFLLQPTIAAQARLVAALRKRDVERPATDAAPPRTARLRMLRPATGQAPRGAVVGMPAGQGRDGYLSAIAAQVLADYEIWAFSFECSGRSMIDDQDWISCARSISDQLLGAGALTPSAFLGFSFGGFLGWLVDRMLVAAGRHSTPVINLDGEALGATRSGWAELIAPLVTPAEGVDDVAKARMLFVTTDAPGWPTAIDHDRRWRAQGVDLSAFALPTVCHVDCLVPQGIRAYGEAIDRYVGMDPGAIWFPPPQRDDIQTPGGAMYRMLAAPEPPEPADFKRVIDGVNTSTADALLMMTSVLLAMAIGDTERALTLADTLAKRIPDYSPAAYARTAILTSLGRRREAAETVDVWERGQRPYRALRKRLDAPGAPPSTWEALTRLRPDTRAGLEAALALGSRPKA